MLKSKSVTTLSPLILSGSMAIDRIMSFSNRFQELIDPEKIDVLSLSVLLDSLTISPGGTAANIAYNLGLLGETPILLASIGNDALEYIQKLEKLGIDTTYMYQSELPTATFTVFTDTTNNQVGGFYPGAMKDAVNQSLGNWQNQKPLVVVSANEPKAMRKQVQECAQFGFDLVYDVGQQAANLDPQDLKEGLQAASVVMVNEYELKTIARRMNLSENDILGSVPVTIVTLGKSGSKIYSKDSKQSIHIPAVSNVSVVDPTGAGDAYRAGFLYGYRRQFTLPMCCKLGSVVASYNLKNRGSQNYTFSKEEIFNSYQQTFGEVCPLMTTK